MIDKKRIEEEAVDAVKSAVRSAEFLSVYISENDKGPCWDGYVAVHKDSRKTKDGIRRVHVQVKGTTTIENTNNELIKYDVETVDLEAYRQDGGCIYFVVTEKYDRNNLIYKQVYYQDLLPFKIYKIQSTIKKHDQKKVRVEFKRFPSDADEITSIFLQFLQNRELQGAFSAQSIPISIQNNKNKNYLEIPLIAYSHMRMPDPIEALLKADAYLYMRSEDTGVLFPVDTLNRDSEIKQLVPYEVAINGKVYYKNVLLIRKRNETKFKIGKSVIVERKDKKLLVHVNFSCFIRQFVKDYEFITETFKQKVFSIGGFKATLDENDSAAYEAKLKSAVSTYEYYKKIALLMNTLGCCEESDDSVDIDTRQLKEKDYRMLDILYRAIVEKKAISGITAPEGLFTAFNIADKSFIVQINKVRKNYKLKRIEHSEWKMFTKGFDETGIEIPLVSIYKKEEYINCVNIDFDNLVNDIKSVPANPYLYSFANDIALRMLLAYDETHGIRRFQLERTALLIFEWLNTITDIEKWDTRISRVNLYLLRRKSRELLPTEISEIKDIIDDSDDSNLIRFGAYVLLEDEKRAQKFYERIEKNEQNMLKNMPICLFWKKKR